MAEAPGKKIRRGPKLSSEAVDTIEREYKRQLHEAGLISNETSGHKVVDGLIGKIVLVYARADKGVCRIRGLIHTLDLIEGDLVMTISPSGREGAYLEFCFLKVKGNRFRRWKRDGEEGCPWYLTLAPQG